MTTSQTAKLFENIIDFYPDQDRLLTAFENHKHLYTILPRACGMSTMFQALIIQKLINSKTRKTIACVNQTDVLSSQSKMMFVDYITKLKPKSLHIEKVNAQQIKIKNEFGVEHLVIFNSFYENMLRGCNLTDIIFDMVELISTTNIVTFRYCFDCIAPRISSNGGSCIIGINQSSNSLLNSLGLRDASIYYLDEIVAELNML